MKFKIKDEFMPFMILCFICPVLAFFSIMVLPFTYSDPAVRGITLGSCVSLAALTVLAMILYFVDRAVGATIDVDDTTVKVSRLFGRKKIAIDDIEDMEIEDYFRTEKHHRVYRMKLTIFYGGGRKLVLKDIASRLNGFWGFVSGEREQLPDEEVILYQACKYIESKMKR